MRYYILSLVCLPFFRSRETQCSYAHQSYYTSISIYLSTAEPNFHLYFTKFTYWETPLGSGLDEVPGPFSLLIASSWSGKVPLHTDDGRGFKSIPARNQSSLKGWLIPPSLFLQRVSLFSRPDKQAHVCLVSKSFFQCR